MKASPIRLDAAGSAFADPMGAGGGFARALAGEWRGHGFSLVVWPSRHADRPCFLELHRTAESLAATIADDATGAEPSTLAFDQEVSDIGSGLPLVRTAGMWFVHPASRQERQAGETLTLITTEPDGRLSIASGGLSRGLWADPAITPVNTAPYAVGACAPAPGTRGEFAPYDLADTSEAAARCRTPDGAATVDGVSRQALLDDPTCLLRAIVGRQAVEHVMMASVAEPGFAATVWIERIRDGATGFDQLQSVQATTAYFAPFAGGPTFAWPQVRVATLRRVARRRSVGLH